MISIVYPYIALTVGTCLGNFSLGVGLKFAYLLEIVEDCRRIACGIKMLVYLISQRVHEKQSTQMLPRIIKASNYTTAGTQQPLHKMNYRLRQVRIAPRT
jgi:hypothetical protein